MKNKKMFCCWKIGVMAFLAIIAITYVGGYSLGEWSLTTWAGASIVVLATVLCVKCRQKEDAKDEAKLQ